MYKLVKNETVYFECNICGNISKQKVSLLVEREMPSCKFCGSTLRFRSIIRALSIALYGKSLALPNFKSSKIKGIGLSDWTGYANLLEKKFEYVNTFFHAEPFCDITSPPSYYLNQLDFVISSEVFEHVPPPVEMAFDGAFSILKPGGVLILTVPFRTDIDETIEHYPNLYKWNIIDQGSTKVLKNLTRDGNEEKFYDLIFHGGEGATLEMRVFSKNALRDQLVKAGFRLVYFISESDLEYGIIWEGDWSVPVIAIKPSYIT